MNLLSDLSPLLSRRYRGSNASLFLRKLIERLPLRQLVGIHLSGVAFFAAILVPQMQDVSSSIALLGQGKETVVEVVHTQAKLQWPLYRFSISQRYHPGHPGMDLTDPAGTPVYTIANGWVLQANYTLFGYGNHVLIQHNDGVQSLYGHMSKILVEPGQAVTRDNPIGLVGSTGWSTGNHVHLEIYDKGANVNPIEVLPAITQPTASVSTSQLHPSETPPVSLVARP